MVSRRDYHTNTVEDAGEFARRYAPDFADHPDPCELPSRASDERALEEVPPSRPCACGCGELAVAGDRSTMQGKTYRNGCVGWVWCRRCETRERVVRAEFEKMGLTHCGQPMAVGVPR